MNNNNHFNTNNWIGTTHLDFFKNSSNALSNYTYNTSNILENDILIYSNINYLYTSNSSNSNIFYTSNTSNIILNRYDPMIEKRYELTSLPVAPEITYPTNQVYINNSNELGEIRFWTKSSSNFYKLGQPFPSEAPRHLVKIDIDGKLKCYYTFDPLLNLTFGSGWVDIINNLIALNADSVNQGTLIGGLEAQIAANVASLQAQISQMLIEFEEEGIILPGQRARIDEELQNLAEGSSVNGSRSTMEELYRLYREGRRAYTINRIREAVDLITLRISQNSAAAFFLGFGGAAFGLFYSLQDSIKHNEFLNTAVKMKISSNVFLTSNQKRDLYTSNIHDMNSNVIDQLDSNYNINLIQGFVNSNVVAQQYLNSINTNEIKISQTNISNIFVASNVASNTSNNLFNYSSNNSNHFSNVNLTTSNNLFNYSSNLNFNSSNTTYIYSSNNIDRYNITLPQENFWYDTGNSVFGYDLNIEKYIPSSNLGGGFKCRSFRIQTIVPNADWRTGNNLYVNNQFVNNPDTLTFHMNNSSNYFGGIYPNENYANGIILGKSRDTNIGYWNYIPENYNYIRYLAKVGWQVDLILERLL